MPDVLSGTNKDATHRLEDAFENLHGWFSQKLTPRLTIASGDTVIYRTPDARWADVPPGTSVDKPLGKKPAGTGHALVGPVYIQGAEPGDTLQVDIGEIVPGDWGYGAHRPGKAFTGGILGGQPDDVSAPWFRHYIFDRERGVYPGVTIFCTAPTDG